MQGLSGRHIAIAGARKGAEISKLIENFGGIPYVRPAQGTVFLDESQVAPDLERLLSEGADWIIFTTGIGVQTLLDQSERLGRREELLALLRQVKIASRGYKTRNVLKGLGLAPAAEDDDGTTRSLVGNLRAFSFKGLKVAVQVYGEMPSALYQWLEQVGAQCFEILPYKHVPPAEDEIRQFIQELREGKFDAVAFTSALQVQYLFAEAEKWGASSDLLRVFQDKTVACAVGIVTAEALEEAGVRRVVQPQDQRMGAMVVELNLYFKEMDKNGSS